MDLLEQVFAATASASAPVILAEQHDVNQIDFVAALGDRVEMGAAGVAATIAAQRRGAIRRASLDVTNGRVSVMVAGELPWHKLGVMVQAAVNSRDAMRLANIDWRVGKAKARYTAGESIRESESTWILYREDTGAELGSCGKLYTPQQNQEGFDFLDEVLAGGQQVWMQAHLPQNRFAVRPGDEIEPYVIFTLDHTGRGANRCYPTTQRVVCANTFRVSARDSGKGIMHLLPTNLGKLADVAGENTRWTTGAVHVRLHGDQTYVAEATNTKIAVRITGESADVSEYPSLPGLDEAPNGAIDGLIPANVWRTAFVGAAKKTKRVYKPLLKNVAMKIGREVATLGYTDLDSSPVERTKLMEGKFPPLADVFPSKLPSFTICFDGQQMITLLKNMIEYSVDHEEPVVEMDLFAKSSMVVIRTQNGGQKAQGLLMCMKVFEPKKNAEDAEENSTENEALKKRIQELEEENAYIRKERQASETRSYDRWNDLCKANDLVERLQGQMQIIAEAVKQCNA